MDCDCANRENDGKTGSRDKTAMLTKKVIFKQHETRGLFDVSVSGMLTRNLEFSPVKKS